MQWERRGGEMNVDEEKVNRRSLLKVNGKWEEERSQEATLVPGTCTYRTVNRCGTL
jgi:hypothetical protein